MNDGRLNHALTHAKNRVATRKRLATIKARRVGSVIYFVQVGKHIKVGLSSRSALRFRLNSFQTSSPYKVKLLKVLHTTSPREDERVFHRLLKDYHVRGEWFLIDNIAILELLGAV